EVLRMPGEASPGEAIADGTSGIDSAVTGDNKAATEKYKTTLLQQDKKALYLQQLNDYMRGQKPFLNADLTLPELAGLLGIPAHHLSQIINSEYGRNFYDFINGYRLQEAARLLKDQGYNDKYITQIMYDSGFNSKS